MSSHPYRNYHKEKISRDCLIQYIPRNIHTVFALLCFVVVIHWLIFPYPSGLLHWHCDNLTIAPVPAKQPWWIWINTSCEFIMNDCITTTKQSTTKPCAYFLGYTVSETEILYIEIYIWQRLFQIQLSLITSFRILYSFCFPMGRIWSVCCEGKVSFMFYLCHCSTESNIMTLSTLMYQEMFPCIFSWTILSPIK